MSGCCGLPWFHIPQISTYRPKGSSILLWMPSASNAPWSPALRVPCGRWAWVFPDFAIGDVESECMFFLKVVQWWKHTRTHEKLFELYKFLTTTFGWLWGSSWYKTEWNQPISSGSHLKLSRRGTTQSHLADQKSGRPTALLRFVVTFGNIKVKLVDDVFSPKADGFNKGGKLKLQKFGDGCFQIYWYPQNGWWK